MRELDAAIDALIERFGQAPEIVPARDEWMARTGRVFEEDDLYENRTVAFLEWFVLERPLRDGKTPVEIALDDEEDRDALRAWARSHRSVFEVLRLGETDVVLADLIGGGRFGVDERRRLHGVAPGDVIEARLVGWRERVRFGRTFDFHPPGTRESIVGQIQRLVGAKTPRAEILDAIAALHVRALRYKHVAAAKVYENATGEP
jgi:hypothetical protein